MSLNPNGISYSWNYNKPDRDGYSLELTGTVVTMQEVQAREYVPGGTLGAPKYFNNGDPMMNIRIGFALEDGSFKTLTITKAGKAARAGLKPSLHWTLFEMSGRNIESLIGKTLHLTTWAANPETGQMWGQGNPRRFDVEFVNDKTFTCTTSIPPEFTVPVLYADNGASGGKSAGQQMPQQMPQYMSQMYQQQQYQPPMQGQFYAAPQAMPQQMPQQMPPVTQMYPPQQMPQQMSMQMPQGMDPQVAAAMQSMNAINVQPVEGVYNDIPF